MGHYPALAIFRHSADHWYPRVETCTGGRTGLSAAHRAGRMQNKHNTTAADPSRSEEVRSAVALCRPAIISVTVFSMFINLLMLAQFGRFSEKLLLRRLHLAITPKHPLPSGKFLTKWVCTARTPPVICMVAAALSAGAYRLSPGASHGIGTFRASKVVFHRQRLGEETLFNGAGIVTGSATHA